MIAGFPKAYFYNRKETTSGRGFFIEKGLESIYPISMTQHKLDNFLLGSQPQPRRRTRCQRVDTRDSSIA